MSEREDKNQKSSFFHSPVRLYLYECPENRQFYYPENRQFDYH